MEFVAWLRNPYFIDISVRYASPLSCFECVCCIYLIFQFFLFFSCWQGVRGSSQVPESDIVQACRSVSVLNLFVSLCCTWEDCLSYSAILMFFSIIVLFLPSVVVGSKAWCKRVAISSVNKWVSLYYFMRCYSTKAS